MARPKILSNSTAKPRMDLDIVALHCPLNASNQLVEFFFSSYFYLNSGDDQFHTVNFLNANSFSNFNMSAKWAFVVHGFLGECYRDWPIEMMKVLTEYEPMNVCCVDWSGWAKCNYISNAQIYVSAVGKYLAKIVNLLRIGYDVDLSRFILIGHSFGAQIIGIAGKQFRKSQLPIGIGEFTGMMRS